MLLLDIERRNRLMTVLLRAALVIGVLSYFALIRTGADPAAEARRLAGCRVPRPCRRPSRRFRPRPASGPCRAVPGPRPDGGTQSPRRGGAGLERYPGGDRSAARLAGRRSAVRSSLIAGRSARLPAARRAGSHRLRHPLSGDALGALAQLAPPGRAAAGAVAAPALGERPVEDRGDQVPGGRAGSRCGTGARGRPRARPSAPRPG